MTKRCSAVTPFEPPHGRCEYLVGHDGPHRHNGLVWHDPPLILIDGQPPDLALDTERWRDGQVLLANDLEPDLPPVFDPYDIPYR